MCRAKMRYFLFFPPIIYYGIVFVSLRGCGSIDILSDSEYTDTVGRYT